MSCRHGVREPGVWLSPLRRIVTQVRDAAAKRHLHGALRVRLPLEPGAVVPERDTGSVPDWRRARTARVCAVPLRGVQVSEQDVRSQAAQDVETNPKTADASQAKNHALVQY